MSEMIGRPLAVVTGASSGIGRELANLATFDGVEDLARMTEPGSGRPDPDQ